MVNIGNHLKMTLPHRLRSQSKAFYAGLLGCIALESPRPDLDLYQFAGGFVLGLFFAEDAEALPAANYLKAMWMELKTDDPVALKRRLLEFGVKEVEYPDPTRFFFQAPGGQVFRVAPLDGGL
jgi:hypothetical protein